MSRALIALLSLFILLVNPSPARADGASQMKTWSWSGEGPARCTITASVAETITIRNGKKYVRVYGSFAGCDRARTIGGGDAYLHVTGRKAGGKRYGGSDGWCPNACSKTVWVPYVGDGTYMALVFYADSGYLQKYGSDPQLQPRGIIDIR